VPIAVPPRNDECAATIVQPMALYLSLSLMLRSTPRLPRGIVFDLSSFLMRSASPLYAASPPFQRRYPELTPGVSGHTPRSTPSLWARQQVRSGRPDRPTPPRQRPAI